MLGTEIDFTIIEIDNKSNIAIASKIGVMQLRSILELLKLKIDDIVKVR